MLLGEKHRESAYIRAILVAENYRRKGVGRKLLAGIEEAAKKNDLKTVYLESGDRDYKKGAFQFYNALGYEVAGHAHIYGESLIFFEKEL